MKVVYGQHEPTSLQLYQATAFIACALHLFHCGVCKLLDIAHLDTLDWLANA